MLLFIYIHLSTIFIRFHAPLISKLFVYFLTFDSYFIFKIEN